MRRVHDGKKPYFSDKQQRKEQVDLFHEKKKTFKCINCTKCFTSKNLLKRHNDSIHEENKIKCQLCSVACKNKPRLKYHVATVHNKNKESSTNDFRSLAHFLTYVPNHV